MHALYSLSMIPGTFGHAKIPARDLSMNHTALWSRIYRRLNGYTVIHRRSDRVHIESIRELVIRSCLLTALLLAMNDRCAAEEDTIATNVPNVLTFGLGLENGFFGFKYGYTLNNPRVSLGIGWGIEGISPHITCSVWELRNGVSFTNTAGIHSSPWGGLIMYASDTLIYYGIGAELRSKRARWVQGYVHMGLEAAYFIKQKHAEDVDFIMSPVIQLGLVF